MENISKTEYTTMYSYDIATRDYLNASSEEERDIVIRRDRAKIDFQIAKKRYDEAKERYNEALCEFSNFKESQFLSKESTEARNYITQGKFNKFVDNKFVDNKIIHRINEKM